MNEEKKNLESDLELEVNNLLDTYIKNPSKIKLNEVYFESKDITKSNSDDEEKSLKEMGLLRWSDDESSGGKQIKERNELSEESNTITDESHSLIEDDSDKELKSSFKISSTKISTARKSERLFKETIDIKGSNYLIKMFSQNKH